MGHSIEANEDLLQAYVLGSRLQTFLREGIPSHVDYDFFTAQDCNAKLHGVQQHLDELALRIDEREHANFIGEVISSSREDGSFESCRGGSPKAKTCPSDTSLSLMLVSTGSGETPAEYGPRIHDSFSTENSILSKTAKPKDCFREMDTIREMQDGTFEERNAKFSANKKTKKTTRLSSPPRPKVEYGITNQDEVTELASDEDFPTLGHHNISLSRANNGTGDADQAEQSKCQDGGDSFHADRAVYISPHSKRRTNDDAPKALLPWRPSMQPPLESTLYVSSSSSCESSPRFHEHQICGPRISKPRIPPESHGPNVPSIARSVGLASSSSFFEIVATGQPLSPEKPAAQSPIAHKGVVVPAKNSSEGTCHVRGVTQSTKASTQLCETFSNAQNLRPQSKEVDLEGSTSKSCTGRFRWLKSTSALSRALNDRSDVATVAPAWQSPSDETSVKSKQKCQPRPSPVDVNGFPIVEELPAVPPCVSPSPDVSRKLTYSTTDAQPSRQRISFGSHAAEMLSIGGISRKKSSLNVTIPIYNSGFEPTDEDVLNSKPSWVSWSDVDFESPSQRSSSDRDEVVDSLRSQDSERETSLRNHSVRSLDLPVNRGDESLRRVSFRRSSTTDNVRISKSTAQQSPRLAAASHMLDKRIKDHFKRSTDALQFSESVEAVKDGSGAQLFFDRPGESLVEDRHHIGYGRPEDNVLGLRTPRTNVDHGGQGESTATCLPSVRFAGCARSHKLLPIKAYSTGSDSATYKQVGSIDQKQTTDSNCNVEMLFNQHRDEQVANRRCRLDPLICPNRSGGAADAIRHEGPVDLDDSDLAEYDEFGNPPKRGCTRLLLG